MVFSSVVCVPCLMFRVPHWRRPHSRRPSWLHYRKAMCNLYECFESVGNELLGLLHEMLPNTALNLQQFWQQSPKCIICCKNQLLNWQHFCNSTSRVENHILHHRKYTVLHQILLTNFTLSLDFLLYP